MVILLFGFGTYQPVAAAPASENTRLRTLFKKNKKTDWLFLILK
jgi:hypothetical protein